MSPHATKIQGQHMNTSSIPKIALVTGSGRGLGREKVRAVSHFIGGGFGCKGFWTHDIACAVAARRVGRPV